MNIDMINGQLHSVRIYSPATVANVSCGFDVLGFSMGRPGDEIIASRSESNGLRITKITGDDGNLPQSTEDNTAGVAARALLDHLNLDIGIDLEVHKKMPLGSGLGSSAASAVGAVVAVNRLLGNPLEKKELLRFAAEGERAACGAAHLDNVAPSLLGGFVLICDQESADVVNLECPKSLYATVVYPHIEIRTEDTRKILRKEVALSKAVTQWSNVGGLVAGILKGDYGLISRSLVDVIIEPTRSVLIPGYEDVKKAADKAGVLGSGISGSGPSIFALSKSNAIAKEAGREMKRVFDAIGLGNNVFISEIKPGGPIIMDES